MRRAEPSRNVESAKISMVSNGSLIGDSRVQLVLEIIAIPFSFLFPFHYYFHYLVYYYCYYYRHYHCRRVRLVRVSPRIQRPWVLRAPKTSQQAAETKFNLLAWHQFESWTRLNYVITLDYCTIPTSDTKINCTCVLACRFVWPPFNQWLGCSACNV